MPTLLDIDGAMARCWLRQLRVGNNTASPAFAVEAAIFTMMPLPLHWCHYAFDIISHIYLLLYYADIDTIDYYAIIYRAAIYLLTLGHYAEAITPLLAAYAALRFIAGHFAYATPLLPFRVSFIFRHFLCATY